MLIGKSGASLLGNILACKAMKSKILGGRVMRTGERAIRASQDFSCYFIL